MRKISGKLVLSALFLTTSCVSESTPAVAQAESQSFEEIFLAHQPTRIESARELRSKIEVYDGRAVELRGDITGLMTREGARTVLLRVGDDTTLLSAPVEISSSDLRAGSSVRIVARVDADRSTPLVMMAVASSPRTVVSKPKNDVAAILPAVSSADGEFLFPQAPASQAVPTVGALSSQPQPRRQPKPLASRGGSPRVTTPASRRPQAVASTAIAPISAGDVDEIVDSQKPVYEALVRRHNKKLKREVVSEIAEGVMRAGYKYNMDPRFLAALIAVESNFDPHCVSSSGAMGLGQIMPFNLKAAGISNPYSPTQNIFGTAKLLRGLLDSYKNRSNGTLLAVAAYNAGSGAVRRAGYKVPNGQQVQRYVWKVHDRYKQFAPDMF